MSRTVFEREPDDRVQILDRNGTVVAPDLVPDLDSDMLASMYADMRFSRRLDERLISLQRQGRVGTYAALAGQEGAQIGSTYALGADDWLFYQYREHGTIVTRGLIPEYIQYWMGHERGNAAIADLNVFPLNISIGSHLPHAVGWAWASKLDRTEAGDRNGERETTGNEELSRSESEATDSVTVVHFGDGATSEGDFHEALNFAGVFDVPAIFFCNNNHWAISVPRDHQTNSATIAQKATAYGFDGIQVDGMDPLATYVVTKAAREKAASPGNDRRPTLIEAVQYRYGAHTTADDPTVYRDDADLERWRARDPIDRFETYCRANSVLDDDRIESIESQIDDELATLVDRAEAYEPAPEEMFEYAYAEPTPRLERQRAWFASLRSTHGDDALLEDE